MGRRERITKATAEELGAVLRACPWLEPYEVAERLGLNPKTVHDYRYNHKMELFPYGRFVPKMPKKCTVPEGIDGGLALKVVCSIIEDPTRSDRVLSGMHGESVETIALIRRKNRWEVGRALDGQMSGNRKEYEEFENGKYETRAIRGAGEAEKDLREGIPEDCGGD